MRIYIYLITLILTSCTNKINDANFKNITLDESKAKELVSLSIKCVDKKYPYKIGYRFTNEEWIRPHYELTPSFYGCLDYIIKIFLIL